MLLLITIKSRNLLHLIDVFAVDSISSVTCGTFSTLPGSIWEACALGSSKARIRKTSICVKFTEISEQFHYNFTTTSLGYRVERHYCSPIGQTCLLHSWLLFASPTHSLPPYLGAGLLQRRLRLWTPPPQVMEQASQGDHGPQPPLTMKNKPFRNPKLF